MAEEKVATSRLTTETFSVEAVKVLSAAKEEPEWLLARRLEAWRIFEETPMPTLRDEEWRRTDIRGLKLNQLRPWSEPHGSLQELSPDIQAILAESIPEAAKIVHNGKGVYSAPRSDKNGGLIFTDLDQAVREYPELVREYFMTSCLPSTYSKFSALHGAFFSEGAVLYVPKGVEVEIPFHSLLWMDTPGQGTFSHTLIILEEGASASFLDEYYSPDLGGQSLHSGVVEIILKPGARLFYMSHQNWGKEVYDISAKRAVLDKDASLVWLGTAFGGELAKANVETLLQGPGSHVEMLGLYFSSGRQFFDHHTLQDHISHHAKSDLLYKGVLTGKSRSVYSGLIRVHPQAQKTDAYQANRNLILSGKARADSIPNLEIMANDVRCTHGATVGQMDEEQLFYLMSRGLPREVAVKLVIDGFLAPVLDRVPWEKIKSRIAALIDAKMPLGLGNGAQSQNSAAG
ncbi:MAG: Fe-S cluster assembly protein SufD [Chloroflexi bacterium]|nr:Fe-S cluster assembly protein SufD [Chloroflexota bacterium]